LNAFEHEKKSPGDFSRGLQCYSVFAENVSVFAKNVSVLAKNVCVFARRC
jgi:hypothetical protein